MFSFYRLVEALDHLDEYRWEKDISTTTKLKPSVFFPLRKAKQLTKRSWEARARMKEPGRVKELFKKPESAPAGERAKSFLATAYRASRAAAKEKKEEAIKAASKPTKQGPAPPVLKPQLATVGESKNLNEGALKKFLITAGLVGGAVLAAKIADMVSRYNEVCIKSCREKFSGKEKQVCELKCDIDKEKKRLAGFVRALPSIKAFKAKCPAEVKKWMEHERKEYGKNFATYGQEVAHCYEHADLDYQGTLHQIGKSKKDLQELNNKLKQIQSKK